MSRPVKDGEISVRFFPQVLRWRVDDLCGTVKGEVLSQQVQDNSFVIKVSVGGEEDAIKRLRSSKYVIYAQRIMKEYEK